MKKSWQIDRRTFLRGAGITIALPFLEAMIPCRAYAAEAPKRFITLWFSNGALQYGEPGTNKNYWECTPGQSISDWKLSRSLSPLASFQSKLNYFNGLHNPEYLANKQDGHWSNIASFLTGVRNTRNDEGGALKLRYPAKSMDIAIAEQLGCKPLIMAPFPMTYGPNSKDAGRNSNIFLANVSWKSQSQVAPRHTNSMSVFKALFSNYQPGSGGESQIDHLAESRKSVLDLVYQQANTLKTKLGASDKIKLDQYLTSIREVERGIASESENPLPSQQCDVPTNTNPFKNEIKSNGRVHLDLGNKNMLDLMVLALSCNLTQVATQMLDAEHNGDTLRDRIPGYNGPAANTNAHLISHAVDEDGRRGLIEMNKWHVGKFLYLMEKMDAIPESNGMSLLDNSLIMFGSGMGNGSSHAQPHGRGICRLTAGSLGGQISTGRFIGNRMHHAHIITAIGRKFGVTDNSGNLITKWGSGTGYFSGL